MFNRSSTFSIQAVMLLPLISMSALSPLSVIVPDCPMLVAEISAQLAPIPVVFVVQTAFAWDPAAPIVNVLLAVLPVPPLTVMLPSDKSSDEIVGIAP